jgi:hypothetical protein
MPMHPALRALLTDTVLHAAATAQDGYGTPTYGPAVARPAKVEAEVRQVLTPQGELGVSQTRVFLNGDQPVGARDKLTLPDGTSPAIQALAPIRDVDGTLSHYELLL